MRQPMVPQSGLHWNLTMERQKDPPWDQTMEYC